MADTDLLSLLQQSYPQAMPQGLPIGLQNSPAMGQAPSAPQVMLPQAQAAPMQAQQPSPLQQDSSPENVARFFHGLSQHRDPRILSPEQAKAEYDVMKAMQAPGGALDLAHQATVKSMTKMNPILGVASVLAPHTIGALVAASQQAKVNKNSALEQSIAKQIEMHANNLANSSKAEQDEMKINAEYGKAVGDFQNNLVQQPAKIQALQALARQRDAAAGNQNASTALKNYLIRTGGKIDAQTQEAYDKAYEAKQKGSVVKQEALSKEGLRTIQGTAALTNARSGAQRATAYTNSVAAIGSHLKQLEEKGKYLTPGQQQREIDTAMGGVAKLQAAYDEEDDEKAKKNMKPLLDMYNNRLNNLQKTFGMPNSPPNSTKLVQGASALSGAPGGTPKSTKLVKPDEATVATTKALTNKALTKYGKTGALTKNYFNDLRARVQAGDPSAIAEVEQLEGQQPQEVAATPEEE